MQIIISNQLSKITGGYCSYRRVTTTALASISQVFANPRDVASSSDEFDDSVSHCNQYSHKAITPKNGDRNAKGQIFSWGNWWDDMN
jgi:hypothetical protein